MKTYEEFLKEFPNKLNVKMLPWVPKEHWQYWFYTYMLRLVPKKYKPYWFRKRCNFIHKPFMEVFKTAGKFEYNKVKPLTEEEFTWEIITDHKKQYMDKIDKAIEILQAYKEGKTIECSNEYGVWYTCPSISALLLNLHLSNLRVKKEPTYHPYTNAEEFIKASIKHGGWFRKWNNQNKFYTSYYVNNTTGTIYFRNNECKYWAHFNDLCESYVWVDDGTPCGKLEN